MELATLYYMALAAMFGFCLMATIGPLLALYQPVDAFFWVLTHMVPWFAVPAAIIFYVRSMHFKLLLCE
jgi:hypothetical protein